MDRVNDLWEQRVQALEAEGLTRSDAQAVADAEQRKQQSTSHTPGPWTLEAGRCVVTSDGRFTVSKCNDWHPEKIVELDANARLIAAAPELLTALKRLISKADELNRVAMLGDDETPGQHVELAIRLANEAIASAEGRK